MEQSREQPETTEERMTAAWVVDNFGLDDARVVAVYLYGSRVYGTHSAASDWDYVVVVEDDEGHQQDEHETHGGGGLGGADAHGGDVEATIQGKASDADAMVMGLARFVALLEQHSPPMLECVFLPPHMKLRERPAMAATSAAFKVSPQRVRETASFRAGHSWSKARKKLEVAADRNVRVAKKSLFHSFRILDFALQMATEGRISRFDAMNDLWREVEAYPDDTPWDTYKQTYQKRWNRLKSQLRAACPKEEWREDKKDLHAEHQSTRRRKEELQHQASDTSSSAS